MQLASDKRQVKKHPHREYASKRGKCVGHGLAKRVDGGSVERAVEDLGRGLLASPLDLGVRHAVGVCPDGVQRPLGRDGVHSLGCAHADVTEAKDTHFAGLKDETGNGPEGEGVERIGNVLSHALEVCCIQVSVFVYFGDHYGRRRIETEKVTANTLLSARF